jgi:tRNA threonylcarbamoyl adenosine modification protein YjeE
MQELGRELKPRIQSGRSCWVLLEGPMGAGKSTASRYLIEALGASVVPEGSPTFAIAHEYPLAGSGQGKVIHLDLYRLEDMLELEAAGVPALFWEREGDCVLVEWASRFPELELALLSERGADKSRIEISQSNAEDLREIRIFRQNR